MARFDVVINGGGLVGLTLALSLAQKEFRVAVIESDAAQFSEVSADLTARVCALNLASHSLLNKVGIWSQFSAKSTAALQRLVVWDDLGGGEITFDAADEGSNELGFIVENREIIRQAWLKLQKYQCVKLYSGTACKAATLTAEAIQLDLDNGEKVEADLCVGADGANSWVRHQMQTKIEMRPYQHQAIIAVIATEKPHQNTGWQNFLTTGPLALLPLQNKTHCAIVWSVVNTRARELMAMDELEFESELNNAFGPRLGMLRYVGDRHVFPLVMRHAENYVEPCFALIGDAAHTIHPLAGQGVNLGFADVVALVEALELARTKRQALGSMRVLRRYERGRKGANTEMILAMRGFYELFSNTNPAVVQLRSQGLKLLDHSHWIKRCFMRAVY